MLDPFSIKRFSKIDPRRVTFTLAARLQERASRAQFDRYALPLSDEGDLTSAPTTAIEDTDVDQRQMDVLARHFSALQAALPGDCVEIGAFRGVTTAKMAELAPARTVFAVDPFMGYGGSDVDLAKFQARTGTIANIVHVRKPSGSALADLAGKTISFIFIDAVHDYVNVRFDGRSWLSLLRPGGLIAFHDVDEPCFAGTRRAVAEIAREADLVAHVPGLIILRKRAV